MSRSHTILTSHAIVTPLVSTSPHRLISSHTRGHNAALSFVSARAHKGSRCSAPLPFTASFVLTHSRAFTYKQVSYYHRYVWAVALHYWPPDIYTGSLLPLAYHECVRLMKNLSWKATSFPMPEDKRESPSMNCSNSGYGATVRRVYTCVTGCPKQPPSPHESRPRIFLRCEPPSCVQYPRTLSGHHR